MIAVLAGLALAAGAEVVVVEDWTQPLLGARGIPPGWRPYETIGGRPAYDFTVVESDGRRALLLKSHDDHSTIARELHVDLRATPILEWSWKAVQLPAGGDIRRKETSDLAALSRHGAHAPHRLRVGCRGPRANGGEEPQDGQRALLRVAIGRGGARS